MPLPAWAGTPLGAGAVGPEQYRFSCSFFLSDMPEVCGINYFAGQ